MSFSPDTGGRRTTRPPYEESVAINAGMPMDVGEERALSEREMKAIVQRELDSAIGWENARLSQVRRQTLAEYFGNRRGDEREGRSSVVTRESFEQVEWALPALMEIFTSGSEVCRFIPNEKASKEQAEQAEQRAEQATDGCNYVFRKQGGFMALYTAFKDALIQKNGVIKVYWEDGDVSSIERYEGKTFQEVMELDNDASFEIRAVTAIDPQSGEELPPQAPIPPEMALYNVEGLRVNTGYVKLMNVAPEEFFVNRDCRGLRDETCRFVANRIRTTESQLVSWGFDPEVIKRLPSSQATYNTDQDAIIRSSQDDSHPLVYSYRQDSERTIYVNDCYVKLDSDGDGVSEWWHILAAGEYAQELLSAEPCNGHPFCSGTAIPIPHRFYGLSIADVTSDIQNINTTLWRQFLDGSYLANDPRHIILAQGGPGETATPLVNLDQLSRSAPGVWVEEYAPNAIRPMESKNPGPDLLPAMEMHQKRMESRTGISPESQGINPESISKHVFGAMVQSSAAQQRMILYARIFAETLVIDLFRLIYRTLLENQTASFFIKLRGEWIEVDPSSWDHEMDCQISVGLGHGSRMERVTNLQNVAAAQEKLLVGGYTHLVSDENLYNTGAALTEALGFKEPEKFFIDPNSPHGQQVAQMMAEQKDPAQEALEAQQQIEAMKVEIDRQKVEVDRAKAMADLKKIELDHEAKILELRLKYKAEGVPMDDPGLEMTQ